MKHTQKAFFRILLIHSILLYKAKLEEKFLFFSSLNSFIRFFTDKVTNNPHIEYKVGVR